MRPTGRLHLGHLHGVLNNWVQLQHEYECFFFVADFHALTTQYDESERIDQFTYETVVDWLAAGVNPGAATVFVQSRVPEHAELHLMLSMITPLSWLERVPSYKDQLHKLGDKELGTYGFLGYPLLQAADILMYRATYVPVGDGGRNVAVTGFSVRRYPLDKSRYEVLLEVANTDDKPAEVPDAAPPGDSGGTKPEAPPIIPDPVAPADPPKKNPLRDK